MPYHICQGQMVGMPHLRKICLGIIAFDSRAEAVFYLVRIGETNVAL